MFKDERFDPNGGRRTLSVKSACAQLGIGKTLFYTLAKAGKLKLIKLGRATRVPVTEIDRLLGQ